MHSLEESARHWRDPDTSTRVVQYLLGEMAVSVICVLKSFLRLARFAESRQQLFLALALNLGLLCKGLEFLQQ